MPRSSNTHKRFNSLFPFSSQGGFATVDIDGEISLHMCQVARNQIKSVDERDTGVYYKKQQAGHVPQLRKWGI